MKSNLIETLTKKYQNDSWSSFYILKNNHHKTLELWLEELLSKVLRLEDKEPKKILQYGHPDLIKIYKQDTTKAYSLEKDELSPLFRLQFFKALELKRRIAIVSHAELIDKIYANKLLKILEDIPSNVSIFFLYASHKSILPTLKSRAIILSIPSVLKKFPPVSGKKASDYFKDLFQKEEKLLNDKIKNEFLTFLENPRRQNKLIEYLSSDKKQGYKFLELLLHFEAETGDNYLKKKQLIDELKWFETAETFHNGPKERFSALLSTLF